MAVPQFDVLIRGAGPAGATAAALLASRGRRVALLVGAERAAGVPEETILPESAPLLGRLGVAGRIALPARVGTPRHGVLWGEGAIRWRDFGEAGPGWKARRPELERELRDDAVRSGAVVVPAPAPRPSRTSDARHEILAVGKHGRRSIEGRIAEELPATVALWARVRPVPSFADATVIEAVPAGWWWWLPLRDGDVALTLFADAEELRARGRDAVWSEALADARGPARGVEARPCGGADATPRLRAGDGRRWPIGDAASTVDPLSSQGLEKALASAADAALTLDALLARPDDAAAETELRARRRAWERGLFRAHAARTLAYYARETRFADRAFWRARDAARARSSEPRRAPEGVALVRAAGVAEGRAWVAAGASLAPAPGYVAPGADVAHDRIGGLPIAALLALFERPTSVDDAVGAAARDARLILSTPGVVRRAVDELFGLGFLEAP